MKKEEIIDHIEAFIRRGETHEKQHKIGVEIEHFVVDKNTDQYVHYDSEFGTRDILKALSKQGWALNYVNGYVLGANKEDLEITIEPGSQLEVSIKSREEVLDLKRAYDVFLNEIQEVFNGSGYMLTYAGYNPVEKIENIPLLPKKRYDHMYHHFKQTGNYGHHMMKGTAALQISIDYENEVDFNRKIKSAYWLSPILYAAFDNVIVFEGEQNDQPAMRAKIWNNCDNNRCGIIKQVFDKQPFTYRDYSEIIAEMPPIFIPTGNGERYTEDKTTHEVIVQYPEMLEEIKHFLGMGFFDVRVKQYIEIRAIDGLPPVWSFAATAFIKNLLYRTKNLDKLYEYAVNTNADKMHALQKEVMQYGMDARLDGKKLWIWLHLLLELAISEATSWEQEQITWLKQRFEANATPRQMRHDVIGNYHCRCCKPMIKKDNTGTK